MARNRSVHTPMAMSVAFGVALALAALTRAKTFADLMHPRTIVLWIPLLVGYWLAIGLRAATFMPSEHRAAWIFVALGPGGTRAFWSGTRAALQTVVLPMAALVALAVTVPLLGWRFAAWHTAFVTLVLTTAVEVMVLTIRHVPFTAIYRPGHAKLRSRWPLYLLGMFATAVWPVTIERLYLRGDAFELIATAAFVAAVAYAVSWKWAVASPPTAPDDDREVDEDAATVLDLAGGTA
jgi:hypothetical protein